MRFLPAVVVLALLAIAGVVLAYPPSTVENVTRDSATVKGLDCGTQYRITVEEWNGSAFVDPTIHTPTTSACPDTTITAGPTGTTTSTSASFSFSSEAGATFECRLDGGAWVACTSPKDYTGLVVGPHIFDVRATVNGQTDPSPASRAWTIEAPPAAPDQLRLSYEADRSPDQDLQGANIASNTTRVCVYLSNSPTKTGPVNFFLDGVDQAGQEGSPPWDYFGGSATVCTLGTFSTGAHTIRATWVSDSDPGPNEDSSTFTVGAPPPPPPGQLDDTTPIDPVPTGYTRVYSTDFGGVSCAEGQWDQDSATPCGLPWDEYPHPWFDSFTQGTYWPAETLSVHDGVLDIHPHTEGSTFASAAPWPRAAVGRTAMRTTVRFRTRPSDYPIRNYYTAWLYWPTTENWPADGELDFPEGRLDGTISGFMHRQDATSGGDQVGVNTGKTYQEWHTAVIDWKAGAYAKFILDGVTYLNETNRVPNKAMRWVLQTTPAPGTPPGATDGGHVDVAWVAVDVPNPNPPSGDYPEGFPDASNTGPTGTLTPRSGGITINTPGTVFENQDVAGHVHVTASNVTVRNVKVTSGSPWPTRIYTPTGGTKPQNVVFEDVEIDCNGAAAVDAAIGDTGLNSTFRRMDIHECEDGIDPADGAQIVDSFMHNFQDPDAPHFDGVQCTGGEEHVTVRHNTLDNQQNQTSAMLCKADLSCCIDDILVENNFLNGGGFTFYSRAGNCCPAPTNVRLLNNWFGGAPGVFAHGTRWGATFGNCSIDGTITKSGNRYWPSGTAIDRC